jgi:hypothetical protein
VYIVEEEMELDDSMYSAFHSEFQKFSRIELGAINCVIAGKRM